MRVPGGRTARVRMDAPARRAQVRRRWSGPAALALVAVLAFLMPGPAGSLASYSDSESSASTVSTGTWAVSASGTYVFKGTNAWTGGSDCPGAQKKRDMVVGYVPSGPEDTHHRTGGTGTLSFCAQPVASATTLDAGTTSVSAWFRNTHGSSCNITAILYANGVAVGSGTVTIPNQTPKTLYTWSYATAGAALATGDQIALKLVWQGVKACDQTDLYWNGAGTPSALTVP